MLTHKPWDFGAPTPESSTPLQLAAYTEGTKQQYKLYTVCGSPGEFFLYSYFVVR